MLKPNVCILRSAGTNCDRETAAAFSLAGARVNEVHINRLSRNPEMLDEFHILALSGGFSYGDDVASGKILANELRFKLGSQLLKFVSAGKLIIGICNGFQILVKSGLLPGGRQDLEQTATLILNDSAKFEARWTYLLPGGKCVWTAGMKKIIYLPVAHGEGKFLAPSKVLSVLKKNGQIVFQYCDARGKLAGYPDNPNGSLENIAGICDSTGRILGLMPHPERHVSGAQAPRKGELDPDGLKIFKNGVDYIRRHFK